MPPPSVAVSDTEPPSATPADDCVEIVGLAFETVVVSLSELLAAFGSAVSLVTDAVSVSVPAPETRTTIVDSIDCPAGIDADLHVTAELSANPHPDDTDTISTPTGSVSVTVTFAASLGPAFAVVSV